MVHVTHNSSMMKVSVAYRQEILARIKEYNLYKEIPLEQLKYREVCTTIVFHVVTVCVFVALTANEPHVQCTHT